MKERVSKLTYPTLQHCLRRLYEWQFQALVTGNRRKKGDINCSSKGSNQHLCKNAYLHVMSFITTEFHAILLSDFRGVALTVVSFILAKCLSSKRA